MSQGLISTALLWPFKPALLAANQSYIIQLPELVHCRFQLAINKTRGVEREKSYLFYIKHFDSYSHRMGAFKAACFLKWSLKNKNKAVATFNDLGLQPQNCKSSNRARAGWINQLRSKTWQNTQTLQRCQIQPSSALL